MEECNVDSVGAGPLRPASTAVAQGRMWRANFAIEKGVLMLGKKKYEEALLFFQLAVEREPDLALPQYYLGLCKLLCGNVEGSLAHFSISIERNDQNPAAYYNRGVAYQRIGILHLRNVRKKEDA